MRATTCGLIVLSLAVACTGSLPEPAPPTREPDTRGYTIEPRPPCSSAVAAAIQYRQVDLDAVVAAAARGEKVNCGSSDSPLALDVAVLLDRPDVVRALLEAGADPNARWTSRGDRFPLQDAIEPGFSLSHVHRREIIGMLLRSDADPNARWCPFESRMGVPPLMPACESKGGVTPLIAAAFYDQADTTYLLLDAGADPALTDGQGFSALDYAKGRAVFELLLAARSSDPAMRREQAKSFREHVPAAPWLSPPPPPPPTAAEIQALISARARESRRARSHKPRPR